ncbi:hypothetical protein FB451DRAFT_71485 [Mycena latifolia]|nr:hypothetical protein FB451DRAFT_71485 [Mycena latifolia]
MLPKSSHWFAHAHCPRSNWPDPPHSLSRVKSERHHGLPPTRSSRRAMSRVPPLLGDVNISVLNIGADTDPTRCGPRLIPFDSVLFRFPSRFVGRLALPHLVLVSFVSESSAVPLANIILRLGVGPEFMSASANNLKLKLKLKSFRRLIVPLQLCDTWLVRPPSQIFLLALRLGIGSDCLFALLRLEQEVEVQIIARCRVRGLVRTRTSAVPIANPCVTTSAPNPSPLRRSYLLPSSNYCAFIVPLLRGPLRFPARILLILA